jgi:LytTr DNA-binding domain-containing protein
MFKFLNKPYPFNDDLKHNAKVIFFISLGVLLFLIVFQPIEISKFNNKQIITLVSGLAASTFLVLSLNMIVLPSIIPRLFYHRNWTIKKEILWNLWILLTISSSDLLFYSSLFNIIEIKFIDVVKIISMGFLPVAVLIIINQDRLLRSHLKSAYQLNKKLISSKQSGQKLIHFESDYKSDELLISPEALLLIKSADNYIEVHFRSEGRLKKQMIRSSLKKANDAVKQYDFILRCHRTCIVNLHHIVEIHGNSQGYKLHLEDIEFPVYVSQKYIVDFSKQI